VLGANCHVQNSLLDERCQLGDGVRLLAGHFPEVRATALTNDLLDAAVVQWRGSIVGPGVALAAGSLVPPGSVLAAGGT
nr:hypothetical protein [Chloroflexaceae bacterium]